jgi:hypothetical protein
MQRCRPEESIMAEHERGLPQVPNWLSDIWAGVVEPGHVAAEDLGEIYKTAVPGLGEGAHLVGKGLGPASIALGGLEIAHGVHTAHKLNEPMEGMESGFRGGATLLSGLGTSMAAFGPSGGVLATLGAPLAAIGAGLGGGYLLGTGIDKALGYLVPSLRGEHEIPGMPGQKNVLESERGVSGWLAKKMFEHANPDYEKRHEQERETYAQRAQAENQRTLREQFESFAPEALERIIVGPEASVTTRALASEVLGKKRGEHPHPPTLNRPLERPE